MLWRMPMSLQRLIHSWVSSQLRAQLCRSNRFQWVRCLMAMLALQQQRMQQSGYLTSFTVPSAHSISAQVTQGCQVQGVLEVLRTVAGGNIPPSTASLLSLVSAWLSTSSMYSHQQPTAVLLICSGIGRFRSSLIPYDCAGAKSQSDDQLYA
jgi:hypothetical protein